MYKIPEVISDFHKPETYFLSNFYESSLSFEGDRYGSSEAAFQAAKTLDKSQRVAIMSANPSESKKLGRALTLRPDWEQVKDGIMLEILREKFSTNDHLTQKLIATKPKYLIEGNLWHDCTWGYCYCSKCVDIPKRNRLGVLLMKVREEL